MSITLIHTLAQAEAAEAAAATGFPWPVIIILGIFVIIAIVLLIPSKKKIESDKDDKKKLTDKDDKKQLKVEHDGEDTESDKVHMSLAEIKDSKRQAVSENHTKDELRELRKERRAATQTAKAIHDRENMAASDEEEDVEEVEELEETAEVSGETEASAEDTNLSAETEDNEKDKITAPIDDIITKTDAGASDVFASLIGSTSKSEMDLEFDEPAGDSDTSSGDVFFPMLGSKLIPLNELTAAAAADDNNEGVSLLDGLTKKIADKAEKKTLA